MDALASKKCMTDVSDFQRSIHSKFKPLTLTGILLIGVTLDMQVYVENRYNVLGDFG